MTKNEFICKLIENFNTKFSSIFYKIFTNKNDLEKAIDESDLDDDIKKRLKSQIKESNYYYILPVNVVVGVPNNMILYTVLYKCDKDVIDKLVFKANEKVLSYSHLMDKYRENEETDKEVETKLLQKFNNLFISKLWYYDFDDKNQLKSITPYDILKGYMEGLPE